MIDLPTEIIVQILHHAKADDIINIAKTSHFFYRICTLYNWRQLYIPKSTCDIMLQINFKSVSFQYCEFQLTDLIKLQKVENIFMNDDKMCDDHIICDNDYATTFSHLSKIGCKNIIFYREKTIGDICQYLPSGINYYYCCRKKFKNHAYRKLFELELFKYNVKRKLCDRVIYRKITGDRNSYAKIDESRKIHTDDNICDRNIVSNPYAYTFAHYIRNTAGRNK